MHLYQEGRAWLPELLKHPPRKKGRGIRQEADLATAPPEAEELIQKAVAQEQAKLGSERVRARSRSHVLM